MNDATMVIKHNLRLLIADYERNGVIYYHPDMFSLFTSVHNGIRYVRTCRDFTSMLGRLNERRNRVRPRPAVQPGATHDDVPDR